MALMETPSRTQRLAVGSNVTKEPVLKFTHHVAQQRNSSARGILTICKRKPFTHHRVNAKWVGNCWNSLRGQRHQRAFFVPHPLIAQTGTWYGHSCQPSKTTPAHGPWPTSASVGTQGSHSATSLRLLPTCPNSSSPTKKPWNGTTRIPPVHTHCSASLPDKTASEWHALAPSRQFSLQTYVACQCHQHTESTQKMCWQKAITLRPGEVTLLPNSLTKYKNKTRNMKLKKNEDKEVYISNKGTK